MTELLSILRVVNITLAAVVIGTTVVNLRWMWRKVPTEVRLSRSALIGLTFAALYGTTEQLVLGLPAGPRTVVTTCALALATTACFVPRRYRLIPRPRRGTSQEKP